MNERTLLNNVMYLHRVYGAKVSGPNSVIHLQRTPIFEWCMIRCGFKNGYQNDTCLKEIGLVAHKLFTIMDSIINMIGKHLCEHLLRMRTFTLIMNKKFI